MCPIHRKTVANPADLNYLNKQGPPISCDFQTCLYQRHTLRGNRGYVMRLVAAGTLVRAYNGTSSRCYVAAGCHRRRMEGCLILYV